MSVVISIENNSKRCFDSAVVGNSIKGPQQSIVTKHIMDDSSDNFISNLANEWSEVNHKRRKHNSKTLEAVVITEIIYTTVKGVPETVELLV